MTESKLEKPTDTERIDWLERQPGVGLIHDDNAYWAVATSGFQQVLAEKATEPFESTFIIDPEQWQPSIREAIDYAIKAETDEAD